MKIQRREFIDDSQTTTKIGEKILTIPIKPGLSVGTEFIFKEVGDQGHSIIPGMINNLGSIIASLKCYLYVQ